MEFFLLLLLPWLRMTSGAAPTECLNVVGSRMTDRLGRERYFHGLNVVVKKSPWLPRTDQFDPKWSFVEKDMEAFQSLGLNAIRLGMMWPGAQPQRDKFNETYFQVAQQIVNSAGQHNIYTLLDMHQDVFSPKFCGEGIPDWAVYTGSAKGFPEPLSKPYALDPVTGYPASEDCARHTWALYYLTEATSAAFQHLYNNTNGLLDQLGSFWSKVASEFNSSPYILGYELINEPWAGDVFADPILLVPQQADRKNLQRVYDTLSEKIRQVDRCHNIFFEPVTWDEWEVGFDHVPGGVSHANTSVLSYHFYEPPDFSLELSFLAVEEDVRKLSCGSFLTEFRISHTHTITKDTMESADHYLQSWLGWLYKPFSHASSDDSFLWFDNGTMNMEIAKVLSRTYAQAVAGKTLKMTFEPSSCQFLLHFVHTGIFNAPTEVYINQDFCYSSGFTVSMSPPGAASWLLADRNMLHLTNNASLPLGTTVMVALSPK